MYYQFNKYNFLQALGLALALGLGSCARPSKQLMKVWHFQDGDNVDAPQRLAFDANNNTLWHYTLTDSVYFRYDLAGDTLWLMNSRTTLPYRIDQLKKKKLVLSSSMEGNFQRWHFEMDRALMEKESFDFLDTIPARKGKEQKWADVVPALHAPTVELRLKNLLLVFQEGDYITTPTIRRLLGIPKLSLAKETEEIAIHRYIVNQFDRITRRGDRFEASLYNGEINADLPIYTQEEGDRILQTRLALRIKKNAHATFQTDYKSIKIDVDGVKLGKGWFLLGMPPLQIEGDWGEFLGLRFYIAR